MTEDSAPTDPLPPPGADPARPPSLRRGEGHVAVIVIVAMAARVAMALWSPWRTGMTRDYTGPCYMLSSGYGYNRVDIEHWPEFKRTLGAYATMLMGGDRRLSSAERPPLGGRELRPATFRMPGYPAFLWAVYHIFGEPLDTWARIAQAVLTSLYPALVYLIALKLFDRPAAALGAAWLTALYPPLVFASVAALPIGLAVGFLLAALLCCIHAAQRRSYVGMFLAGGLLAASCYFRTNSMLLWIPLGVALLIRQKGWKRPILSTALLAGGVYLGLLPWAWRNHHVSGYWLWGSSGTGTSVWKAIGEQPNPWGIRVSDRFATEYAKARGFECDITPEADTFFREEVLRHVHEDPGFFARAALRRLPLTLAPPFETGYVNPHRTRGFFSYYLNKEGLGPWQVVARHPAYVLRAYWERILVLAGSAAGTLALMWICFSQRRRPGHVALLLAGPIYWIGLHAATIFAPRYMTPILPMQMIALAVAWGDLRRARVRRRRLGEARRARRGRREIPECG